MEEMMCLPSQIWISCFADLCIKQDDWPIQNVDENVYILKQQQQFRVEDFPFLFSSSTTASNLGHCYREEFNVSLELMSLLYPFCTTAKF